MGIVSALPEAHRLFGIVEIDDGEQLGCVCFSDLQFGEQFGVIEFEQKSTACWIEAHCKSTSRASYNSVLTINPNAVLKECMRWSFRQVDHIGTNFRVEAAAKVRASFRNAYNEAIDSRP